MSEAVLVVDDDPFIRRLITTTLEDVGHPLELLRIVAGLNGRA